MQNTKDWQAVKLVVEDCHAWSKAFVVMGSLILTPHERTSESDIDILIVVDSLPLVLDRIPGLSEAAYEDANSLLQHREINAISTKSIRYGAMVSISVISMHTLMCLASLAPNEISYYRTTCNHKPIEIRSFDSSSIKLELLPTQFGVGYIVSEPHVVLANSRKYLGVFPDAILSLIHVCYDDGSFSEFDNRIWHAASEAIYEAIGSRDIEVLTRCLIASKVYRNRLPQEAVTYIHKRFKKVTET